MGSLSYDVLVIGGGPSGIGAAVGAGRCGVKTALVERYGFLGGMATTALVHPWMSYYTGREAVTAGVFQEVVEKLKAVNSYKDSEHFGNRHHCFDFEYLKFILQEMTLSEKIDLFLHSLAVDVTVKNGCLDGVFIESKSGREYISAKVVIDATGDGDVCRLAGVPYEKGRETDGLMQPVSLHFRMGGVKTSEMPSREQINQLYNKAKEQGRINNPRENLLWFDTTRETEIHFNTTRVVKIDGTSREDLTKAEIEARRQVMELVDFLRQEIAGFEEAYLLITAPQIGIRETRRITGEYQLTEEDVLEGRKFPDAIACGAYSIDIHNPQGTGTVIKQLPIGAYYQIPYRCLLPLKIDYLLVTGRPISTTHSAHSSTRIQPICYATGQAGGIAAALSVLDNRSPKKVEITKLQHIIRQQKGILELG